MPSVRHGLGARRKPKRMEFDLHLPEAQSVQLAAEDAAWDRYGTALESLLEVIQTELLKEAANAYDGAVDSAYTHQQERRRT